MNKTIAQLVNELDIPEPEYTSLYELFTDAGITQVRWFKVANFIEKKFKMGYFDKVEKHTGIEYLIMAVARGYDEGLRDGAKRIKK